MGRLATRASRANLRTAIWRIKRVSDDLLCIDSERVAVSDLLEVDVHEFRSRSEQILAGSRTWRAEDIRPLYGAPDLLSGWDEDWLLLCREQIRFLRLHTLEFAAHSLCQQGLYPQAIDAILPVVAEEPLRESAHAILINAHLNAGNAAAARRQFDAFAADLWRELRLRPSPELLARIAPATHR